ncbi:helix-turn-helix domain-containing protein [Actinospica robiniae]|uniref:helix-turn-helix domain-containing protein n=1 Tax=Actinospica robiniae TaxID=304901 RepID=UPI0003F60DBF|nr:helix-turn-helix transcriptional regulator [Actinospica robiniae]
MRTSSWDEVKRRRREIDPGADDPGRRAAAALAVDTFVAGHHLAELRKTIGMSQAEVAAFLGVSQARVSDIERGRAATIELDTLRAYAQALGGVLDITVRVGPHSVKVA